MEGSLWAAAQEDEQRPEIDVDELQSLFAMAAPAKPAAAAERKGVEAKPQRVNLIDLRRANNCEIMLTKVKMPLPEMLAAILRLDDKSLDTDTVENLIKFCPTKEEADTLRAYDGDKSLLGKCEQFFLELMSVPRIEAKLRVFSFKIEFNAQVEELKKTLTLIISAAKEVRESETLTRVMRQVLELGNIINQGTARGGAKAFKLDSLSKLGDVRAVNNKMTLMHYLGKTLQKMPDLAEFYKELSHLEPASKVQLKALLDERQAVLKGLEKVEAELAAAENDGPASEAFSKVLREFYDGAKGEEEKLNELYREMDKTADLVVRYFGEDPTRKPFEDVCKVLVDFMNNYQKAVEDNKAQEEAEKKKKEKEEKERAEKERHGKNKADVPPSPNKPTLTFKSSSPPALTGSPSRRRTAGDEPLDEPAASEAPKVPRFLQNMKNLDRGSKPFKMLDVDVSQLGRGRAALRKSSDEGKPAAASEAEKLKKKVGFGSTFAVRGEADPRNGAEKKGEDQPKEETSGAGKSGTNSTSEGTEKEGESAGRTVGTGEPPVESVPRPEKPKSRRTSFPSGNKPTQNDGTVLGTEGPGEANGKTENGRLEELDLGTPMKDLMVRVRRKSGEFVRDGEGSPSSPQGLAERRKVSTPKSLDFRERLAVRRAGLSSPRETASPSPSSDRVRRTSGSPGSVRSSDSPLGKAMDGAETEEETRNGETEEGQRNGETEQGSGAKLLQNTTLETGDDKTK
ncbi:Actin-binding FH2 (Formin Homology) protein [Klebsormidium nitens]|uniref:Formin-like protein n=1 Tax=Klebsormidium nitens TaxID=105231 RepID=A0A1Y1HV02_KLENI|nr:Actin-binding FH2 (Formin Homology) protein [Klebsormidium nitens]|eukprot:GAQ82454.1 Actin-binding FH2 (Formin Homology) protein [Klebsormidium nitens]